MGFIKPNNNSGGSGGGLTPQELSRLNDAYSHSKSEHAPTTAEENVQADWNETDETSDAYIKNKPTISNDGFNTISSNLILNLTASEIQNSIDSGTEITLSSLDGIFDENKRYIVEFLGERKLSSIYPTNNNEVIHWNIACNFGDSLVDLYYSTSSSSMKLGIVKKDTDTTITATDFKVYEETVVPFDAKYLPMNLTMQNSISMGRIGEIGNYSIALGFCTEASGYYSFSQGRKTTANGNYSHAEGFDTTANSNASHAEGISTTASANASHAEGYGTIASNYYSHAEGYGATASGAISHAEGFETTASGDYSHVEGSYTTASSSNQHVQGKYNIEDTENKYAHIVGNGTDTARSNAHTLDWEGNGWYKGKLSQDGTPTEDKDLATKKYVDDAISQTTTGGEVDLSGYAPIDSPDFTGDISMNRKPNTTIGKNSVALGGINDGVGTIEASGDYSIATGMFTVAKGAYSHAEGFQSKANETSSHAEGVMTQASATGAHSEGGNTVAKGYFSHAEGSGTIASGDYQHAQGKYNIEDTEGKYAHIVGNGTASSNRSNAHTLDWNGNAWYKGTISCDGTPTNDNDLITKAYFEANKGEGGSVDLSGYAPIDSPDFTGDISLGRKDGTTIGQDSVALGFDNESSGTSSITLGTGNIASQSASVAIGRGVQSLSPHQCVLGKFNIADSESKYACIFGNGILDYDRNEVRSNAFTLDWEGNGWFKGNVSIDGTPTADNHLINKKYVDDAILHATTGGQIDLSGYAKSDNPVFTGALSMYRKSGTAVGQYSVALGSNATASGKKSVAIGDNVTASGSASFACGAMCTASGSLSHAEGFFCTAGADSSHAEGCLTQALGQQSHSEGNNTIAKGNYQHVQGIYNIEDTENKYAHIVGNGTADNARVNIHTVAWDGKGWFKGDVYVGGTSQADGKKLLSTADIYFDTDGNLCVTIGGVTKKFAPIG